MAVGTANGVEAVEEPSTASVVGGSGFAGGELLRLLSAHPAMEVVQATSRKYAGRSVGAVHPNLRGTDLRFTAPSDLEDVDVLFAATPHGVAMERIDAFRAAADVVVDLSADFRLEDGGTYDAYYDGHERPGLLGEAVYGLPERHRAALSEADLVACPGCNATVTILALAPLVEAGLLEPADRVVADLKVGSSEGGADGGLAASHAERSGVVRPYAPTGHRHEAEVAAELGLDVAFSCHAVDMIRGASVTCHAFPEPLPDAGELWSAYRGAYADEPFVRLVGGGTGAYRAPEPKVLAGTNYCDVGLERDPDSGRLVVVAAIDNVTKGAAGGAVQSANVALGLPETAGLSFQGLHPVGSP